MNQAAFGRILKPRVGFVAAAAFTIAAGLACRSWLHGAPAKVGGVALYAALVYWLVRIAQRPAPDAARYVTTLRAAAIALAISWGVEFLQLTPIPARISAVHPLLRLIFGEVFSTTDLLWYPIGVAAVYVVDLAAVSFARSLRSPTCSCP